MIIIEEITVCLSASNMPIIFHIRLGAALVASNYYTRKRVTAWGIKQQKSWQPY